MLDFIIFAVVLLVFLIVAVIYLYPGSQKLSTVPGLDASDPAEGNFPDIMKCGSMHEFLVMLHGLYGDIASFWFGPTYTVSIASHNLFKENSHVFDRPVVLFKMLDGLFGSDGVNCKNGSEGRARHAAYARCYSDSENKKYFSMIHELTDGYWADWAKVPEGEHLALNECMFNFSVKNMLRCSYGKYFRDDTNVKRMSKSYHLVFADLEMRMTGDYPEPGGARERQFNKNKAVIQDVMLEALMERRKMAPHDEYLLIDALTDLELPESTAVNDMIIVAIAGIHTVGIGMAWAVYFLASHPPVQDRLYEEIVRVLGKTGQVTAENMSDLIYMRQVIDETFRCSVLAPYAGRVSEVETELGGHRIPARTPIVHALGVSLQDERVFPDPSTFDPDRFSAENEKKRPPFSFEPFGFAGKRVCPGKKFGYVEATVVLATLLRRFKVDLVPGQVVTPLYGFVTKPHEEIWITISKRA